MRLPLPPVSDLMEPTRRRILTASAGILLAGPGTRATWAQGMASPAAAGQPLALAAAPLAGAPGRLGYDGTPGGPLWRVKQGTALRVTLANRLDAPTAFAWHGLRGIEAGSDTKPLPPSLAPGTSTTLTVTPLDSGIAWFHAVALPGLPDQTAAGLRGVLVVEEREPPTVDGDLVVVLEDGETTGSLSVNGAAAPLTATLVPGARVRLRIVNASTTRILVLAVEGARPKVIAIDGQPSELFEPIHDAVPAGPGARFELMIDCPREPGQSVRVLARGVATGDGPRPPDVSLVLITTAGQARAPLPPIAALPPNAALPAMIPLERSARATLLIEPIAAAMPGQPRWRLNGVAELAPPPTPLLSVRRGSTITLAFDNRAAAPVPIHVEGQAMRLLHAMDDGWEPYWRDGVILAPRSVTHVAFVAVVPGRWLIDSAFFDQATAGLRTWFLVT